MIDSPELIAICYDEDYMCSHLHSDTAAKGHPENPARLKAIIERLRSSTITLGDYGERDLLEFTRSYRCRPADRNTLYYCHSKRHVQQLVTYCRDIAELNDEYDTDESNGETKKPFLTKYPVDQDTYLTSKSEKVARMAVGGIVRLVNVIMGRDIGDRSSFSISRSVSSLTNLAILSEDLDTVESLTEVADLEAVNIGDMQDSESNQLAVDTKDSFPKREESWASFYGAQSDVAGSKGPTRSQMTKVYSLDNLMNAFKGLDVSTHICGDTPPLSVRKGFALLRPPGHHATREKMMGFCLYNNVAIAAAHLQKTFGLTRIAIVDIDVHHGNGTQDIFYNDSEVCFISIHRFGTNKQPFYPYSGNSNEVGGPSAIGTNVNIPLAAGYTTHDVVYASQRVILPKLEAFRPEFILVSCGYDAAENDPLGGCQVTPDGYSWLILELCKVAEKYARGRLLLALEGGYNPEVNADCTEAIFKTLMRYEMDRSLKVTCGYDFSKVKKSTITICSGFKKFIKDPSATPSRTSSFNSFTYDEHDDVTLKWTRYRNGIDENSFVLAGGHLNQFILPFNGSRNELCKLCSSKEVEFYRWLYAINDRDLTVIDKEYSYLTLPFSSGEEKVYITGLRLVTDPAAAPTVKPDVAVPSASHSLPQIDNGVDVVKDLIKFVVECSAIYTNRVFAGWNLQNSHTNGIRLRNALADMREPCVMDLKMGTRLYGDDVVEPMEIEQKEIKACTRSSKSHGFHISGMFRWVRGRHKAAYLQENVAHMLKKDDDLVSAFALYFNRIPHREVACSVIDKLITKLMALRSLFERQKALAFYGTSLLFVFDAHARKREDVIESANVYMIDLSHVSYNTGCIDSGYLLGLRTVIILLNETKKAIKARKKFFIF